MTTQITDQFEAFLQRITLSDAERVNALEQGRRLSRRIEQQPEVRECLITGSMVRSTAIRKFSDVDIVAVIEPDGRIIQSEPTKLISSLTEILRKIEPNVQVSENAIRITHADGRVFDVLAAIHLGANSTGDDVYQIPSTNRKGWESYAPEEQNRRIREASELLGGDFKKLIRLCKWWSKTHGQPIPSYEIELTAYEAFPEKIPELPKALVDFSSSIKIAANSTPLSKSTLLEFKRLAQDAYSKQVSGDYKKTIELWGKVFGDEFTTVIV
ncbi:hypothetical protein [Streptomyces sp. NPDC088757]|uniref:SMODS domain-containing nucleotidyltransferase n=1 Tax=Streptomyces sp. NPDC088757 TaxID=3365889 RepID=UPI00380AFFA8